DAWHSHRRRPPAGAARRHGVAAAAAAVAPPDAEPGHVAARPRWGPPRGGQGRHWRGDAEGSADRDPRPAPGERPARDAPRAAAGLRRGSPQYGAYARV